MKKWSLFGLLFRHLVPSVKISKLFILIRCFITSWSVHICIICFVQFYLSTIKISSKCGRVREVIWKRGRDGKVIWKCLFVEVVIGMKCPYKVDSFNLVFFGRNLKHV